MDNILSGLFSLAGMVIGGLFSLIPVLIANKNNQKNEAINDLCDQVGAYWNLEDLMAEKLTEIDNRSARTIKDEFRTMVSDEKGTRPIMTQNEANRIRKKFNY